MKATTKPQRKPRKPRAFKLINIGVRIARFYKLWEQDVVDLRSCYLEQPETLRDLAKWLERAAKYLESRGRK
jgi:hypothetical protein